GRTGETLYSPRNRDVSCSAGNAARGWNDPPQLSYALQARGGRRGPLTRRAHAPPPAAAAGPSKPPGWVTPGAARAGVGGAGGCARAGPGRGGSDVCCFVLAPAPEGAAHAASSPKPVGPPPLGPASPALREGAVTLVTSGAAEEQDGSSPSAEDVVAPLTEALGTCRACVQKQVCDDISRRLAVLQDMWAQGKLSSPVKKRMAILVQELQKKNWDSADEIHDRKTNLSYKRY
uniref:Steroid receptor RNA activator 1 n=1 Tax=Crocodylus porosus TaxID=8502 RepID=A0A7M4E391_CROPO